MRANPKIRAKVKLVEPVKEELELAQRQLRGFRDQESRSTRESIRLSVELLSRISLDPISIIHSRVHLATAIDTILVMLGPYCEDIEIESSFGRRARTVQTSELDLLRILGNLIKNSAEALNSHEGEKSIRIKTELTENEEIAIIISDTGPGLPQELAKDPFAAAGLSTKGQGRGAGFASMQRTAKMLGGRVELVETSDAGTAFKIILPKKPANIVHNLPEKREQALQTIREIIHDVRNGLTGAHHCLRTRKDESAEFGTCLYHLETADTLMSEVFSREKAKEKPKTVTKLSEAEMQELQKRMRDKHVLLIDDSETMLEILPILLKQFKPLSVTTTQQHDVIRETLANLDSVDVGNVLLLLDNNMPIMDGYEFAEELRQSYPNVKYIFYSGNDLDDSAMVKGFDKDLFDAALSKTFKNRHLLDLLRSLSPSKET